MYYLQTRYYDSNIGRFINADSALYHELLGYNMYAYCNNNPVMFVDYTGENAAVALSTWFEIVTPIALIEPTFFGELVLIAGAVIIGIAAICEAVENSKSESDSKPKEAPKSVTESEKTNKENDQKDNTSSSNNLPTSGEPNSDKHLYDKDGLKQTRHYGPDGRAEYDIDYRHQEGNHKFPHKHVWDWTNQTKPRGPAVDIQ